MPKSKAQKRANRKKRNALRLALAAPLTAGKHAVATRGRPKVDRDVGPTAQTLAKLKPDTLAMLRAMRDGKGEPFLSAQDVEAGEEILQTWSLITAAVGFRSNAGGSSADRDSQARVLAVWRRWCGITDGQVPPNELYRRCLVTPAKIVDWLKDSASCDRDPKGAAGVLKRALEWWRLASRDVGRGERTAA